jgi:CRP/FNR family transcriptional regulator, anaerobic regulatory protein
MRVDIGSYLGMKLETVSRTFTAFQQQGLLKVDKKHVKILDLEGLQAIFDGQVH